MFFCQRLRGLALIMRTETLGSTASSSSISTREWFEDSPLEGEAPIRVRLLKKGGKKTPMLLKKKMKRKVEQEVAQITLPTAARVPLKKKKKKKFVQNVEQMVEVRVVVKIALKDVVSSKGLLAAHVAQGFNSDGLSERRRDKKGKGKVENWRQRPVRSGVFQRTLRGELSFRLTSMSSSSLDVNVPIDYANANRL